MHKNPPTYPNSRSLSLAQLSVVNTSGTGLLLSSYSESFITAPNDLFDRASSVFMEGSAQWGSVRVRVFTANRVKIPI